MNRKLLIIWAFSLAAAGCMENPQVIGSGVRIDAHASSGTSSQSFTAPGWKAGDKVSWEQQLKTRAQNGQNDYNKVN